MTQRALCHDRPGHSGQPLNYIDTTHAYDKSIDIPLKAKHAKMQMMHFLDPNILVTKKQPWNNLTTPGGPFAPDRGPLYNGMPFAPRFPDPSSKRVLHVGTSTKAEIDLRAEKLPMRDPVAPIKTSKLQFDPRLLIGDQVPGNLGGTGMAQVRMDTTVPPGKEGKTQTRFLVRVDPTGKLDLCEEWDGTTVLDGRTRTTMINHTLEKALINSQKKNPTLTAKRTSLIKTYKKNLNSQRDEKKLQALKQGDLEVYLNALNDYKSKQMTEDEADEKQKELDRMELVYSKDWKAKEYYCDGVWAYDVREGRHRWSCCGSVLQDSPGCQPRKRPGQGWNYASTN